MCSSDLPTTIIADDQDGVVYITNWVRCGGFLGCQPTGDTRKYSTVTVDFVFDHTYNAWSLNPLDPVEGPCVWSTYAVTISQAWSCTYQRPIAPGQYWAQGTYYLVNVSPPWAPGSSVGPGGICTTPEYAEFCAVTYRSSINYHGINLPWTPPGTLNVTRLC